MKKRIRILVLSAISIWSINTYAQFDYVKRINCGHTGGNVQYRSKTFEPDIPVAGIFDYTGDNFVTSGHSNFTLQGPLSPVRYTKQPSMQYDFYVDNGNYQVFLHLAEPYHGTGLAPNTSDGTRQFDIDIEGQYSVTDLNVYSAAGNAPNMVYVINERVNVVDGKLTITFSDGSGNDPIINAIEVIGIDNGTCPTALENQSSTVTLSNIRLGGGADFYGGTSHEGDCGVRVVNLGTNEPWAKHEYTIDLAANSLVAGDQLNVSVDAFVESGRGRIEFNVNNTPNTGTVLSKTFENDNTDTNLSGTITIPAGAVTIDIWTFPNYTLNDSRGSVVYKNLNVAKVGGNIPVTGISVSPTDTSVEQGQTASLTANVSPNGADQGVVWSSSDSGIATVASNGTVTAVAIGNATITATSSANNTISASTTVTVTASGTPPNGGSVWSEANSVASYTGKVQIGDTPVPNEYKMAIDGKLITEEVKVQLSGDWPDYVFEKGYELPTLEEIKKHIDEKGHLPNIPSAKEVKTNGIELGVMNKLLLEKIEELTLYILEQEKKIKKLQGINDKNIELEARLAEIETLLKKN